MSTHIPASVVLQFWGLTANPYDPQGTIGATVAQTESMRSIVEFVVKQADAGGLSAVLGSIGDGKTTAIRAAKRQLLRNPARYLLIAPVTLATGSMTPQAVGRLIFDGHGSYAPKNFSGLSKITAVIGLIESIPSQTVLVIDEGHHLQQATIRLIKELSDSTAKVSIILAAHHHAFMGRLAKQDSKDLQERIEVGRIMVPQSLGLEDARRIVEQRRALVEGTPEVPDEVLREILAQNGNPLGLLSMCWQLLEEAALQNERTLNVRLLRLLRQRLSTGTERRVRR